MGYGNYYGDWAPYVPVAQRKAQAIKQVAQLAKKENRQPSPVKLEDRKFATTFWGQAWCDNLGAYSDFSNRLPRGATYVRNGSVVDLVINSGSIKAIVAGSEVYTVKITIAGVAKPAWKKIKQECSASIESLLDLLAGKFSDGAMKTLTQKGTGLFPSPREIKMDCSCPDYSYCCKHIAAVMYGVGNRLDMQPELLFLLRDVDHRELVSEAMADGNLDRELSTGQEQALAGVDLGDLFGIDLESTNETGKAKATKAKTVKVSKTKPVTQKTVKSRPKQTSVASKKSTKQAKPAAKAIGKAIVKTPKAAKATAAETTKKPRTTAAAVTKRGSSKKVETNPKVGVARRTK
ncbi:MAG: hypothetical protein JWN70_992 [Planctomycetaceae bacterium]|nr:hypothetical protein [Planctomycetaceae bacterium]